MSRRAFAGFAGGLLAASTVPAAPASTPAPPTTPHPLGVFLSLQGPVEPFLDNVAALGVSCVELVISRFDEATGRALRAGADRLGLTLTAIFAMGPGPQSWDFPTGPSTNGLVPRTHREARIARLKEAADFAARWDIPAIETHCGFIPEDPANPLYGETVAAIREVAAYCQERGLDFLYHAGQETPVTLLRTIEDVGLPNQGIGLDTANGILYGTGHPADAVEVYGRHVRLVNAKDGLWPTDPRRLGREVSLGDGRVDFPRVLKALHAAGFSGPIQVEREISGPEQMAEIRRGLDRLKTWLAGSS